MPNLAGKAIGEFLSGVGDSLKDEFALGKQVANNPRPLSFENLPDIGIPSGPEFSPEQAPSPALLAALIPTLVGDVVGLGLDIEGFTSGRLEITPFNLGLSGLGLLPFIPSLGAIRQVSKLPLSNAAKGVNQAFKKVRDLEKKEEFLNDLHIMLTGRSGDADAFEFVADLPRTLKGLEDLPVLSRKLSSPDRAAASFLDEDLLERIRALRFRKAIDGKPFLTQNLSDKEVLKQFRKIENDLSDISFDVLEARSGATEISNNFIDTVIKNKDIPDEELAEILAGVTEPEAMRSLFAEFQLRTNPK